MKEGEPNFHLVSKERQILRQSSKEGRKHKLPESVTTQIDEELTRVDTQAAEFHIPVKKAGKLDIQAGKRILEAHKERSREREWINENDIAEQMGSSYGEIVGLTNELQSLEQFEMRRLREASSNPNLPKRILETIKVEKANIVDKLEVFKKTELDIIRAHDLVLYAKGLHQEGHIAPVPSVKEDLRQIGLRMISGLPMFVHGPTGGGKTSLARYAADHYSGKPAEMVYCNPQTRESAMWGKTGIRPAGKDNQSLETVDVLGPLAKAMRDGSIIIFDEFTALPREQMVSIKGVFNSKPGDTVNIPGNGAVHIAPGFQMIFTANLKSDKNPERQDMPPEVTDEFAQNNLEVGYQPENESYDIMLARLMNSDGSIDLSSYDLYETLPNLARAMSEIQTAYADVLPDTVARLTGTMDAAGKKSSLRKLNFTQRSLSAILEGWKVHKHTGNNATFTEFVDERLVTLLNFKEYPLADRQLAAKLLALHGFLRELDPVSIGLVPDTFSFEAAKKERASEMVAENKLKSSQVQHFTLGQLAALDPFGEKAKQAKTRASKFKKKKASTTNPAIELDPTALSLKYKASLAETYKGWGIAEAKINAITALPEVVSPSAIDYAQKKDEPTDPTKFGETIFNPDTQGIDWENIPESKLTILPLTEFVNKPLSEVAKHIVDTYSATHHIPGIEYWQWLSQNQSKIPPKLKDGNWQFFFGSLVRSSDGSWHVPFTGLNGGEWERFAHWLGRAWNAYCRVVLLER